MMHEDFVAVSESLALVTRGEAITHLTEIATVAYSLDGDLVVIGETVNVDVRGTHLRLGHPTPKGLAYSERGIGLRGPASGLGGVLAEQPFIDGLDVYYNDRPAQGIYRNGEPFLVLDDVRTGKPWVDGRTLYYEARDNDAEPPWSWRIERMDLDTGALEVVVTHGANPCVHAGRLFYSDFRAWPAGLVTRWRAMA